LKKLALEKNFDYEVVKNQRWSAAFFQQTSNWDHFFQRDLNSASNQLFFGDKSLLLDLYNGF